MTLRFINIAITVIISAGVYLNTLSNGFVFDDLSQVLKNRWINDIRNIPAIFTSSVWSFEKVPLPDNYYRPMMHIIYMIEYHIFGLEPWGWHLVNVIFHSGVTVLVFLVAYNLFNQSAILNPKSQILNPKSEILYPAFIASLLFATHPIHTEAVAWIGGIPELLYTFFYLLAFYSYISKFYLFSTVSYFFSILSKEPGMSLPLFLISYDYLIRKEPITPLRPWIKRYIPYMIVSAIYILLRIYALESFVLLKQKYLSLNFSQNILNIFPLLIGYLQKLLFPINLNALYTFHPVYSLFEKKTVISIAITFCLILFLSLYKTPQKSRDILFNFLWMIIPLIPVLYIPVVGRYPFAERYLYLPSVGFVILAAIVLKRINGFTASNSGVARSVASAIIGIIIVVYSIGTIERNYIWRNEYTLWTDTVRKSPDSSWVHNNLGSAFESMGLLDEAIAETKIAVRIDPDYAIGHYGLGILYTKKGLIDEAITEYKEALRIKPDFVQARNNLGAIYRDRGLLSEAITEYKEALKIAPNHPDIHNNLGVAYMEKGLLDEAIVEFKKALKIDPEHVDARHNLGSAYVYKGLLNGAVEEFKNILKKNPEDAQAHYSLGLIYSKMGLIDQAISEFKEALKIKPDYKEAEENLNQALYLKLQ